MVTLTCASSANERQHCAANTASGILLARSVGSGACLLGKTWGYDDSGVWVQDGCGAEFIVARSTASSTALVADSAAESSTPVVIVAAGSIPEEAVVTAVAKEEPEPFNEVYGFLDPGKGFLVGKTDLGELSISGYALVRYMNQVDSDGVFTDHLGRERPVDGRKDIYSHRVLVWLDGWLGDPKLRYTIGFWTVNATDQDAIFGNVGYQFNKKFNLYAGIFGNYGSRTMAGSHPYWLGHDRVMADEFFRPFFTQGAFANGEIVPGLFYSAGLGNTSSTLGTTAVKLDRKWTYSGSFWWMPTTHEFGPRGGFGDYEFHQELATRFGMSATYSPEQRYSNADEVAGNTALRLADSVNVFETGSLVPGVTVTGIDYSLLATDAGMKYKGFFLQTEFYYRVLDSIKANGYLPMKEIKDWGFYVQTSFFPIPKKLEIYGAVSQIFGDESLGFSDSSDWIAGMNYYPFDMRNMRVNFQYNYVDRSPVSSSFGYYVGGLEGSVYSAAASVFF